MPLITLLSSTRALPRVSVGKCGAIFENCCRKTAVLDGWAAITPIGEFRADRRKRPDAQGHRANGQDMTRRHRE